MKNHGWYEGRKFDISSWISQLSKEGYICFDYAREILEELGGIVINIGQCNGYMGAQFSFYALTASGEFDRLEDFEKAAGENLYPLGEMVQAFAYVGPSRNIYFGYGTSLYLAGKGIEEYLNNLFMPDRKPAQIC